MAEIPGDYTAEIQANFKELQRRLLAIGKKFLGTIEGARDLAQDTWMRILSNSGTYDETKGSFRNWALQIGARRALNTLRKERSYSKSLESLARESPRKYSENETSSEELSKILEQLDPLSRSLLERHYLGGESYKDISASLEEPINTIKSRMQRAKAKLRKYHENN